MATGRGQTSGVQVKVDEAVGCRDVQPSLASFHFLYDGVDDGDKYLGSVVVDLKERLRRVLEHGTKRPDVAVTAVDDVEADHFVEVEAVAFQFGKQGEGQVELSSHQGQRFLSAEFVKGNDGFVAVQRQPSYEVGHQTAFRLHQHGVQFGVLLRLVHVEITHHFAFEAERFCDPSQVETFLFRHALLTNDVVLNCVSPVNRALRCILCRFSAPASCSCDAWHGWFSAPASCSCDASQDGFSAPASCPSDASWDGFLRLLHIRVTRCRMVFYVCFCPCDVSQDGFLRLLRVRATRRRMVFCTCFMFVRRVVGRFSAWGWYLFKA